MEKAKIARIESAPLVGRRPREAGNNSRLNIHGVHVQLQVTRLTTVEGATASVSVLPAPKKRRRCWARMFPIL